MNKLKSIYASSYSAVITIAVMVVIILSSEFSVPFKNWLASFTGHHWVTKSWISIILFVLMYLVIRATAKSVDQVQTKKALVALQVVSILGFAGLLGFYMYEFFK